MRDTRDANHGAASTSTRTRVIEIENTVPRRSHQTPTPAPRITPVMPRAERAMKHRYTAQNNLFHRFGTDNYYRNRAHVVGYDDNNNHTSTSLRDRDSSNATPNVFTDTFYRSAATAQRGMDNIRSEHRDRGNYRAERDGYVANGINNHGNRHGLFSRYNRDSRAVNSNRGGEVTGVTGVSRNAPARVTRAATPAARRSNAPTVQNARHTPRYTHHHTRNMTTRGVYRNTVTESRNATITFVVLLVAIAALLALAIYALMRPRHDRVAESRMSDNDSVNRRR
jgi:hypothetical protein